MGSRIAVGAVLALLIGFGIWAALPDAQPGTGAGERIGGAPLGNTQTGARPPTPPPKPRAHFRRRARPDPPPRAHYRRARISAAARALPPPRVFPPPRGSCQRRRRGRAAARCPARRAIACSTPHGGTVRTWHDGRH